MEAMKSMTQSVAIANAHEKFFIINTAMKKPITDVSIIPEDNGATLIILSPHNILLRRHF